jgi:carbamoyl-phosphate synthase small subunit
MNNTCYLILSDGTVFRGKSFGAPAVTADELTREILIDKSAGEVVFNTAMSGYHEVLTDPSYTGQIVVMTYPHIGNYGDRNEWSEIGPENSSKRSGVKASGFVVREYYDGPVPEGRESLNDFLKMNNTPGISGIDTRALTLKIREGGSPNGLLISGDLDDNDIEKAISYIKWFPSMEGRNLIGDVGTSGKKVFNSDGEPYVALLDCGTKANILRELINRHCKVAVYPSGTGPKELLSDKPDILLISNGPGDPRELYSQVETIRSLIGQIPMAGICLGHQLLGLALGCEAFKMKFGHHGANHPVRDEYTKKVFVTSQNHGFSIMEDKLPAGTEVWFRNANDNTVEGIFNPTLNIKSAQFHPEAAPGPRDSSWIFDSFLELALPKSAES